MKKIFAVGIGPGSEKVMTEQAAEAIRASDVIVGYKPYCEQVRHLAAGKRVLASGMRAEVDRCNEAIDEAEKGLCVAVISSGDAGVYGMAGLVLELVEQRGLKDLEVEVVPGVSAANAAAAVLGAPLMNDFAVISLSDLLTDQALIRRRLQAVAGADMVCALYNPRSTKRRELFDEALRLFREVRGEGCVCGLVKDASRPGEWSWVGRITELPVEQVDMLTVAIVGSSQTVILGGRMVTRRGYRMGLPA